MAKLEGSDILFAVWDSTGSTYKTIVCLTQQGVNRTKNVLDTSSKCDEGYSSSKGGRKSITMPLAGLAETAPATGAWGWTKLEEFWNNDTEIDFKIYHKDDDAAFPAKYGKGIVVDLNDTYNDAEIVGFDSNINVNGALATVDPHAAP